MIKEYKEFYEYWTFSIVVQNHPLLRRFYLLSVGCLFASIAINRWQYMIGQMTSESRLPNLLHEGWAWLKYLKLLI